MQQIHSAFVAHCAHHDLNRIQLLSRLQELEDTTFDFFCRRVASFEDINPFSSFCSTSSSCSTLPVHLHVGKLVLNLVEALLHVITHFFDGVQQVACARLGVTLPDETLAPITVNAGQQPAAA